MPNEYVNKVVADGVTKLDLTADTVTASTLAQGYTAHDASGAPITGTATGGSMVIRDELDSHGGTIRHITAGDVVTGTIQITSNGTVDVASYADAEVNVTPDAGSATTPATTITANPSISVGSGGLITATTSATKSVTPTVVAGYVSSGTAGTITVLGSNTSQLSTQAAKTVTPSESSQTAVAAGKYTTGAVTVGAISSTYVGSGITSRSSIDLSASGATVTAPAGYYASSASKSVSSMTLPTAASSTSSGTSKATIGRSTSDQYINIPTGYNSTASYYKVSAVANGTEGTPTATKGTVSNHAVSVTPSVTNSAGYISGGTKTGTAVTVTASELVSGTKSITENGTGIDVTNYASVDVAVAGGATHTGTITGSGSSSGSYVQVNGTGTQYSADGATFSYKDGDYLKAYAGYGGVNGGYIVVDGTTVADGGNSPATYNYTLPPYDIGVEFTRSSKAKVEITTPSLSITSNGTYDVEDYASVSVDVGGGGGTFVTGTFTTGDTRAARETVSINYAGSGYPLAYVVYSSSVSSDNDVSSFSAVKNTASEPSWTTAADGNNTSTAMYVYKQTQSMGTLSTSAASYVGAQYTASSAFNCVKFIGSGATLGYYIGNATSSTRGLAPSTTYNYLIVYSS